MGVDPVQTHHLLLATAAAAAMVFLALLYAVLFAWARVRSRPGLMGWAYAAYALLGLDTMVFARLAQLNGHWLWLVVAMLAGYFLAPRLVWALCVGTHCAEPLQPGVQGISSEEDRQ